MRIKQRKESSRNKNQKAEKDKKEGESLKELKT